MIREIEIENFKSIRDAKLRLGRFNVLIGENGSGKSNLLEAIAVAGAAAAGKLDHEFLASRGIRTTAPRLMLPAFDDRESAEVTSVRAQGEPELGARFVFGPRTGAVDTDWQWRVEFPGTRGLTAELSAFRALLGDRLADLEEHVGQARAAEFVQALVVSRLLEPRTPHLGHFLIYSPENSALRAFQREGQILPLGINGEGLFAHLRALSESPKHRARLDEISDQLALIDWFSGFEIPSDLGPGERRLDIKDRYLAGGILDQRSTNEGFLLLLFYFTLFASPDTPRFFAIDNVDASLNPRLCSRLIGDMVTLAVKHDRQVIVTTHNPAVLDGLNLHDNEQRLLVVSRGPDGATRVRRASPPKPLGDEPPVRLSEAFLRGYLGGLPKNF